MTLSEAIRLGALLTFPQRQMLISENGEFACALGAAIVGAAISPWNLGALRCAYPELDEPVAYPPDAVRHADRLWVVIASLNDHYGWARERIADWVAYLERK